MSTQDGPASFEKVTLTRTNRAATFVAGTRFGDESVTFALVDDYQRGKVAELLADGWIMVRRWRATPATRTVVELEVTQ